VTPTPLLKALIADRLGLAAADWASLAATYGAALAPFAGLAPENEPATAGWRRQVSVEALGHLGTLQELQTFGMPFLVLKGVAWGAWLWDDVTARPAHDLDIVIQPTENGAWQQHLSCAGFSMGPSPLVWRRHQQIVQLHGVATDRHWLHGVQPPWAAFWARSIERDVAGHSVRQPDAADSLLYLAHHQVFRHGFDHDQGWVDLAGWLRHVPADRLEMAWERARGSHLASSLSVLAWAWRHLWGFPGLTTIPEPSWPLQWLARWSHGRPGDWRRQSTLSLALATGLERRHLLQGLPAAVRRLQRWQASGQVGS
jgi:hypothetical protein